MGIYIFFWISTLAIGPFIRRNATTHLFVAAIFIFIGLRLETGFDWPVYKEIFSVFEQNFQASNIFLYTAIYGQEPGFLLLLGLSAKYIHSLEFLQAVIAATLLLSITSLARFLKIRKVAFAVAIIMTFIMWSVGFSTLRQSLAISFFNFGLIYFWKRNYPLSAFLFFLSTSFQLSAIIYIAALLFSKFFWKAGRKPSFIVFSVVVAGALFLTPVVIDIATRLSPLAARKLDFYISSGIVYQIDLFDFLFFMFFAMCAFIASRKVPVAHHGMPHLVELRKLIVILAGFGACSIFISVVRDRISYEVFILISLLLMTGSLRKNFHYIIFFVVFGIGSSALTFLVLPARIAFVPYQNVVSSFLLDIPSTGDARSSAFMEEFIESTAR